MTLHLKLKIFQTLSEALLPLLGYFYWSWSIYDLLLFYLLDLIVASVFTFVKIKKVSFYNKQKINYFGFFGLVLVFYSTIILLGLLIIPNILVDFSIKNDTLRFLMLKDMGGIPQFIFLFPLVFYAGYLQYKMKFLQLNLVQKASVNHLQKQHYQGFVTIIAVLGLSFGIVNFVPLTQTLAVFGLIVLTGVYSFFWKE